MAIDKVQFPVANQAVANRKRDAAEIQLRQAISQYRPQQGVTTEQAAGQLAATGAAQQGQIGREAQAQTAQMAQTAQQQQLATQGQAQQQALAGQQLGGQQQAEKLRQTIYNMGQDAADQELESRLAFMKQQGQQKYLSDRNYADYAVLNAKSDEEFQDYAQAAQQAHDRYMQMIDTAFKVKIQEIQNEMAKSEGKKRQALQKELAVMQNNAAAAQSRARARSAKNQAVWQAAGSIVGSGIVAGAKALG